MNAREKFKIGNRVELSAFGRRIFVVASGRPFVATGKVVGFARDPHRVRVLRDEHKSPERYHIDFWQRVVRKPSAVPR